MFKKRVKIQIIILILLSGISSMGIAQDNPKDDEGENNDNSTVYKSRKGFHIGLYVGSLFANKYTAGMYDGYGFDIDGNKNSFENSFMYQKIILQYGGGYGSGQPDMIAQELNVDQGTWTFDESDMPLTMRYSPAFLSGLQCRYSVDENNAILLNVNAAKLNINGSFNITTIPTSGSTQINNSIRTFAIKGTEQRLMFQFGYNRIIGSNDKLNFYVEGGLNATLTKFDKNIIQINNLTIDLTSYYNQAVYPPPTLTKKPVGMGFGAFAGFGINLSMGSKWAIQIGYNPSYERINIGPNPRLKMQHSFGLRAYRNF